VETALKIEEYPELTMLMGRISNQKKICDLPVQNFPGRTRCYAKVQDGCNNFCTYCIVPYTRGPSRSLEISKILKQIEVFQQQGYRELVLTGINIGKYGLDLDEHQNIYTLLDTLCTSFPEIRIRLSSIEPTEVNETLLDLITRYDNFMPHLHIPLQSGDDDILRRMYRHYTAKQFQKVIHHIHTSVPEIAIGCDVLSGFPGETDAQAENTYQLLADLPVSYLHVFPYSKRPGTLADSFSNHVPQQIKKERVSRLQDLGEQLRQTFYEKQIGTHHKVLVERRNKATKLLQGFSENYIPLFFEGPQNLIHSVVSVAFDRVEKAKPHGILLKRDA
jgi:threonylcarbamoyladenosine tRNA methylthiotransferase MtaB